MARIIRFWYITRCIFHSCIKLKLYTCSVFSCRNKFNPAPSRARLFRGPRGRLHCLMDCERVCVCICIRDSLTANAGEDAVCLLLCVCVCSRTYLRVRWCLIDVRWVWSKRKWGPWLTPLFPVCHREQITALLLPADMLRQHCERVRVCGDLKEPCVWCKF